MNLPLPPRLSAGSALCFVRRALRPRGRAARPRAEAPGAAGGAWPAASFGETGGLSSGRRPSGKRKVSAAPRLRLPPPAPHGRLHGEAGSGLRVGVRGEWGGLSGGRCPARDAGPAGRTRTSCPRGDTCAPAEGLSSPSRFPARGARGCCPCSDSRG